MFNYLVCVRTPESVDSVWVIRRHSKAASFHLAPLRCSASLIATAGSAVSWRRGVTITSTIQLIQYALALVPVVFYLHLYLCYLCLLCWCRSCGCTSISLVPILSAMHSFVHFYTGIWVSCAVAYNAFQQKTWKGHADFDVQVPDAISLLRVSSTGIQGYLLLCDD